MKQLLKIDDWIIQEDGLFRGRIADIGTIGNQKWPCYKVDIGDNRFVVCPSEQAKLWYTKEQVEGTEI